MTFLYCEDCGDVLLLAAKGNGECSDRGLKVLEAGSTDAAQEKHVPYVQREGNHLHVQIGSVEHPMTEAHYIQFIAVEQGSRWQIAELTPNDKPVADFEVEDGPCTVYEYCNLHGLWKAEA